MKHSKDFYRNLPKHNGFKWVGFADGLHMFTKGNARNGYSTIYLEENDIADEKNLEAMLVRGFTRNPEDYKAA